MTRDASILLFDRIDAPKDRTCVNDEAAKRINREEKGRMNRERRINPLCRRKKRESGAPWPLKVQR